MTVKDYIETFGEENEHIHSAATLLKWINLVESNVYADTIKNYLVKYYSRTLNEFQFSLPDGVDFEDVVKLYVNGIKYKKRDVREYKKKYTYWYEGGKLCIYPSCAETDASYVSGAGEITFTGSTIVTTGDDFSEFSAGDVVTVSGCTVNTENNISATIIDVDDNTLTFSDDTFTAGAETGEITIQKATIKMVYLNVPTTKLIGNIATDTLLIPDRFIDIYDYFLLAKIAYTQKEFSEYQNHMMMFNNRVAEYERWWDNNRPQNPESDIIADEDIGYTESLGFDSV